MAIISLREVQNKTGTVYTPSNTTYWYAEDQNTIRNTLQLAQYSINPLSLYISDSEAITSSLNAHLNKIYSAYPLLYLNDGESGSSVSNGTAGIVIDRGTSTSAKLVFDDTDDKWKVDFGDGNLIEIKTESSDTFLNLNDTPSSYGSTPNNLVRINGDNTALEFTPHRLTDYGMLSNGTSFYMGLSGYDNIAFGFFTGGIQYGNDLYLYHDYFLDEPISHDSHKLVFNARYGTSTFNDKHLVMYMPQDLSTPFYIGGNGTNFYGDYANISLYSWLHFMPYENDSTVTYGWNLAGNNAYGLASYYYSVDGYWIENYGHSGTNLSIATGDSLYLLGTNGIYIGDYGDDWFVITSSNIDAKSKKIVNVSNPTSNQDVATKYYVDNSITNATLNDESINVNSISSTYSTQEDLTNTTSSTGKISGGNITDNGDGTITVSSGEGLIRATDSDTADIMFISWNSSSPTLTDNAENYIYVDYNSGTLTISSSTTFPSDHNTKILLGMAFKEGTKIHILTAGQVVSNYNQKDFFKDMEINGKLQRVSGFMISEKTDRKFAITSGSFYGGLTKITLSDFDSSGTDTFTYYYRDGSGGWTTVSGQTQIDNTNYDDGSGTLSELSNSFGWRTYYGVHWVYEDADGEVIVLYGRGNYLLSEAQSATPPTDIPDLLTSRAGLVGKIIIQKNATSFEEISSPFTEIFSTSIVSDHNLLSGLQGGTSDEYYHLTSDEYTNLPLLNDTNTFTTSNYFLTDLAVGTTTPTETLTINGTLGLKGDSVSDGYIKIKSGSGLRIDSGVTAQFRMLPYGNDIWFQNTNTSGKIFFAGNSGVTLTGDIIFRNSGNVVFGDYSATSKFDFNGDRIRIRTSKTPTSATDTGVAGEICWDSNYIYVCVATDTWKRVALNSW